MTIDDVLHALSKENLATAVGLRSPHRRRQIFSQPWASWVAG